MHPDVEELQPKLKEILYDCAVDIKATKAALYLFDGKTRFELVTEYGFRGGVRRVADTSDPVIDRCGRGRTPFYINGVASEPRFAELLFESATDRLLAVPLYQRGQLIGAIDMRDKAAKQPFDQPDVARGQRIADRIMQLFAGKNIFGQRFITLSEADQNAQLTYRDGTPVPSPSRQVTSPGSVPVPAAAPPAAAPVAASFDAPAITALPVAPAAPAAAPPLAAPAVAPSHRPTTRTPTPLPQPGPRLAPLILEARNAVARFADATPSELFTEAEVAAARDVLRSVLLIPGSVATMFSAFGQLGGVQEISARSTLTEEAQAMLQSKLNVWLSKRGESGGSVRTSVQTPFGTSSPPITPQDLQKVFTAPLTAGSLRSLYLTVAFANTPDRVAHELLAVLHTHLQLTLEQSMQRASLAASRVRIAEKIIEPDFARYVHLRTHSERVARVAEAFARFLSLPQGEADAVKVVALVHDSGMRLLDYDRLYRKRNLTEDELSILREHVVVGAALVEPMLGTEIAKGVLHHHERFDGGGYPSGLSGEEIPFASRVLAVCDTYVAMTDPDTYQTPDSHDEALAAIRRGAGGQFDAELAQRFVEMMSGGSER